MELIATILAVLFIVTGVGLLIGAVQSILRKVKELALPSLKLFLVISILVTTFYLITAALDLHDTTTKSVNNCGPTSGLELKVQGSIAPSPVPTKTTLLTG